MVNITQVLPTQSAMDSLLWGSTVWQSKLSRFQEQAAYYRNNLGAKRFEVGGCCVACLSREAVVMPGLCTVFTESVVLTPDAALLIVQERIAVAKLLCGCCGVCVCVLLAAACTAQCHVTRYLSTSKPALLTHLLVVTHHCRICCCWCGRSQRCWSRAWRCAPCTPLPTVGMR